MSLFPPPLLGQDRVGDGVLPLPASLHARPDAALLRHARLGQGAVDAALPELANTTMRATMPCLRCHTEEELARRANAVRSHPCLGCHYHQYEIGPPYEQVRVWRAEVGELVLELAS